MENEGGSLFGSTMFVGIFVAAIILLLTYILKLFNNEQKVEDQQKNEKSSHHSEKKKEAVNKTKKKVSETKWSNKADKQGYFTHPWLIKSLKGHTGEVLDIDFSSNNKYLISCADEDPGGSTESSNSSTESTKDSSNPPSVEPSPKSKKGLSRRQRKNRRKEDVSPETKRRARKKPPAKMSVAKKQVASTPLTMWVRLNMEESQLYFLLDKYVLIPKTMKSMGYPFLTNRKNGEVLIYKTGHRSFGVRRSNFDVNAKEFVPKRFSEDYDSGQGSGNSSDSGENIDDSEVHFHQMRLNSVTVNADCRYSRAVQITNDGTVQFQVPLSPPSGTKLETTSINFIDHNNRSAVLYLTAICVPDNKQARHATNREDIHEHTCVRCQSSFITSRSEYVAGGGCTYHWGKTYTYMGTPHHACCKLPRGTSGCTVSQYHVWNGVEDGHNYFKGYVETKRRRSRPYDGNYGVYALDCEMSYTVDGLELTKVTVVAVDGRIVYDSFVKPDNEVLDYNTRFSGITSKDLVNAKSLKEVQNDLMGFINADTILVGHGLENDLRALRMVHRKIVDTVHAFPHHLGLPFRRSLKQLAWYILQREIQNGMHCSYEDAVTSMELILSLVRKDTMCI